VLEWPNRAAC